MKQLLIVFIILLVFSISPITFAHSGRTDSTGGHNCSNSSISKGLCTGYHYHNGGYESFPQQQVPEKVISTPMPTIKPTTKPTIKPFPKVTPTPISTQSTKPIVSPVVEYKEIQRNLTSAPRKSGGFLSWLFSFFN